MIIKEISYSAKAPTYDYANQQIGMRAQLEEGEDESATLQILMDKVHSHLKSREDVEEWERGYRDARHNTERMQEYYDKALKEYSKLVEFCKANGIKNDFQEFPALPHIQRPIKGYLRGGVNIPEIIETGDEEETEINEDGDDDDEVDYQDM
jgi:hypothetical protein